MDRIGRYQLIEVLASGEAGTVYRAEDPRLGRDVAIFIFAAGRPRNHGHRTLAMFSSHPTIVDIHDAGEHEGQTYHVLEYIDGRSLAKMVQAGVRFTTDAALSIAEAIARALHFMHVRGVQHNNVSPDNVVLRSTGEPVLIDFHRASQMHSYGPIGAADVRAVLDTITSVLTRKLSGATIEDLAKVAPPYVVELIRRGYEGQFSDADDLARSLHATVEAHERFEEPTKLFGPREGDTMLLHADHTDADHPGSYREYLILAHLSAGGFGEVYRALDRVSGRTVALKVLRSHLLSDAEAVARFRREAHVLAYLRHPCFVRIFNYGRFGASAFIAMELIEGPTLADIRRQECPMPLERAASLVVPILRALELLAEAGIVHRDLKPTNVKVSGGRVVLLDFGIAQVEGWEGLTQDDAFIGTLRYAAPEQLTGRPITPATDIYACGVILYELLTGSKPHHADDARALMLRIATEPVPSILEHRNDLPTPIANLLDTMLALDSRSRPSAAEAARVLETPH